MAIREICLLGNPILRKQCRRVGRNIGEDDVRTVDDLRDTLDNFRATHGFGRGIAAPQIGVDKRIIFVNMNRPVHVYEGGFPLIDPVIVKRSRQMMLLWDDCFSFSELLVKVRRNVRITVRFRDSQGRMQRLPADGDFSELLQHEIDHINGVLAIDRAIDLKHVVYRSEWERQFKAQGGWSAL